MRRGRGRRERLFGGAFGRAILCGNVALRGGVVSQRVGVELYRAQARVERVEQRPDIARILAKVTLADLRGAFQMNAVTNSVTGSTRIEISLVNPKIEDTRWAFSEYSVASSP